MSRLEKIEEAASRIYSYFRASYKGNVKKSRLSERDQSMIKKWAEIVDSQSTAPWTPQAVFRYVAFQYEYWSSKDLKYADSVIPSNMIYGQKAVDRWNDRNKDNSAYFSRQYAKINGFRLKDVYPPKTPILYTVGGEDEVRAMDYGEKIGLANCIVDTTMYDIRSNFCRECKFAAQCRELQKKLHFRIYLSREDHFEKNTTK